MLYGDIPGFRAYAALRGNGAPTAASDTDAEAALQRGSDYIRLSYVRQFVPGCDLPEADITEAAYIAAARELAKPGFFAKTFTPGEAKVLTGAGKLSWTLIGDASTEGAMRPVDQDIEDLLGRRLGRGRGVFGLRALGP